MRNKAKDVLLCFFSLCTNGCLTCRPSLKNCSTCSWSEWSSFGVCSAKCNGTQTRYRSRSCVGLTTKIEHENRTCSTNQTSYKKGCEQCSCDTITGQERCHAQCAITPDICSNLTNDPLGLYEYIPPKVGECCGSCNRTNSMSKTGSSIFTQKIHDTIFFLSETESCPVQNLPLKKVTFGNCISINPIARQQCLGTCISGIICRCCSPSKITIERIPMKCQHIENNSTITLIKKMSYAKIDSCSCQECAMNN